jgi:hypothetical protein
LQILRHVLSRCGIFSATCSLDVGYSSPPTHRMGDILRHLHTGWGIFFATYTLDGEYSSPPTHRMGDILRHLHTGCGTFSPPTRRMSDIFHHLHTGCKIFFATYILNKGYSLLRTHTHTHTHTLAPGHSSPPTPRLWDNPHHTQTHTHRLCDILHHIHMGCRTFTIHPFAHAHRLWDQTNRHTGWFRKNGKYFEARYGRSLWEKLFTWTCV